MGFAGLNITYPCKQAVIPLLDDLSDEARAMGAVNTVVCRDGRLIGHNTDGSGWSLRPSVARCRRPTWTAWCCSVPAAPARPSRMRCCAWARSIWWSTTARANAAAALAQSLNALYGAGRVSASDDVAAALRGASGLIHATPTGMDKLPGLPLPGRTAATRPVGGGGRVLPDRDRAAEGGARRGCATVDGGGMAVWQAVGAFKLFTGLEPDAARMEAHFRRLLAARRHGLSESSGASMSRRPFPSRQRSCGEDSQLCEALVMSEPIPQCAARRFLMNPTPDREAIADATNPLGLDGIEFIEYATTKPQALGQVLEMMGFRPIARHRSREVLLYRQGDMNIIVNAHAGGAAAQRAARRDAGDRRDRAARARRRRRLPPRAASAAPGPCRRRWR